MKAGRIEETFARLKAEGRTGFVAFLTVGYPDVEATLRLVPALIEGGADVIELGLPFSAPPAAGSSFRAGVRCASRWASWGPTRPKIEGKRLASCSTASDLSRSRTSR